MNWCTDSVGGSMAGKSPPAFTFAIVATIGGACGQTTCFSVRREKTTMTWSPRGGARKPGAISHEGVAMNLALLVHEMRALGLKSLALELDDGSRFAIPGEERPTLAPEANSDTEVPPKDPELCAHEGCGEKRGGIFGGLANHLCRSHAMQSAGVRTT
jgi:hypothetical protein